MTEKTNVQRLIDGGAVMSADDLSAEHQRILNSFTEDEIKAIIKLKKEVIGVPLKSDPDGTGGAML